MGKKKVPDDVLLEAYTRLKNVWKVGEEVGLSGQTVHERLKRLSIPMNIRPFTDDDRFFLKEHYNSYLLEGKLQELADKMGRTKQFICRQAKKMGLTDISRPKKALANYKGPSAGWNKTSPRFKDKKHTDETIELLAKKSKEAQEQINNDPGRRESISKKQIMTKLTNGTLIPPRQKQTWKAGWREVGGKRKYFRSKWEANYARYLEFLKVQKQILDWHHEVEVFWFEGIKRGCVSYLPDFKVTELNGSFSYHEVKGWMDNRSKTKLRRMEIYHPDVVVKVIDANWFKRNNKTLMAIIYGWE